MKRSAGLHRTVLFAFIIFFPSFRAICEDGYRLWLRYEKIRNDSLLKEYSAGITGIMVDGDSPTLMVIREELQEGLCSLLGKNVPLVESVKRSGIVIAGTPGSSHLISSLQLTSHLEQAGEEGYILLSTTTAGKSCTVIAANNETGTLYGIFHFLRLLQTHKDIKNLSVLNRPKINRRILNHWDNLDRTVERGYAGFSLWNWHLLPDYVSPRIRDYARANASIGINGTVLTNVNANALVLTREYLGFATHLVFLSPLFRECLYSDTHVHGEGSFVARVIDGTLDNQKLTGIAGVSNIGTERNWCGHPFAQANWYAFGQLGWDHSLTSDEIADDWIRMTFTNDQTFIEPVKKMMLSSRETAVNYMTPLGLHHIMAQGHHYGPGPWVNTGRADWTSVYYHRSDSSGIGFDRTGTGSNASGLYFPPVSEKFGNIDSCPEEYLLWFHHVPWDHVMSSDRTLWEELCHRYHSGVEAVRQMQKTWATCEGGIDPERYTHVESLLKIQEKEAVWWHDACLPVNRYTDGTMFNW